MARPKIKIDQDEVRKLAEYGCTNEEMADFFNCSTDTIERRFAGILTKARAQEKMRLRKLQWNAAQTGNTTMLIWLGKQKLAQTEKVEEKVKIETEIIKLKVSDEGTSN